MVDDLTRTGAPRAMPDAMPAGAGDNPYFGRQSMRPPGSGPSPREIETQQQWATATPIVTQARTTAQSAQAAADAALQSKAPADIARAKDQKKTLVGQLQEAQASRAGMDTPEDARLAETLASLSENTSDPVLLSTQISAAKTSLDRLLTDIGSPVEGNLIPVKTNILTRTQAPRSAAEGPQDRASVTRYAEGSDDVQPMGFGAGTPKSPQQAVRFETPGSPEYEAAVAKGLDMSQAGRMARARKQGFNTNRVLYHGTNRDFESFDVSKSLDGLGVHMGTIDQAETLIDNSIPGLSNKRQIFYEGAKVLPLYVRANKSIRLPDMENWEPHKVARVLRRKGIKVKASGLNGNVLPSDIVKALKDKGYDSIVYKNRFEGRDAVKGKGADSLIVFDPSNIRSVNAAFDPEKSGSSTLLAAAPFAAVGGAGLTSERELGSKMTRDKKD
jgi:hypothetical protein